MRNINRARKKNKKGMLFIMSGFVGFCFSFEDILLGTVTQISCNDIQTHFLDNEMSQAV